MSWVVVRALSGFWKGECHVGFFFFFSQSLVGRDQTRIKIEVKSPKNHYNM